MKLVCLAASLALPLAAAVTPLQKVLEMLDGMLAKGKAEKHEEEVEFAKFKVWCDDTREQTQKSIDRGGAQITQLEADIAKAESDAEVLGGEVEALQGEIAKAKDELDSASAVRDKEHGDFMAQHQDYSESVDAIERAIATLKSRSADVPQSLAQMKLSPLVPERAKALVESFLAVDAESTAMGAPEASAYEFQSGGVVDLLEKLLLRFQDERLALEKGEMNAKHNHEMLTQQLTRNMESDTDSASKKSSARAARLTDAAGAKGDHATTQKAKEGDEATLSDTLATCAAKAKEFEENQVTRADELKVIQEATKILAGDAVQGHAETHLPTLLQAKVKGMALAQLRSVAQRDADVRSRAAAYLQGQAKKLGSRYLSLMAARVTEDPFAKVKTMIKGLITKLMEESNAEADKHAYCTAELATNKMTREDKSAEVDKLSAEVEGLTATVGQLAGELAALSDAISEMQGSRMQATAIRNEEKATNEKTLADAREAQVAVEQAISLLRSFYDKQAESGAASASALLQARAKGAKAAAHGAAREPYTGMGGQSTGVLGMLEVVLSDFARLEAQTSAAEESAATAHTRFMDETETELALKSTTVQHEEDRKQQTEERLHSTQKELQLTQSEMDAALSYYDQLKADCLDTGLSYTDRVKMREEEIQSLQEALKMLNGEDSLV